MRTLLLPCLLAFSLTGFSQPSEYRISRQEYIDKYKDEAVKEMFTYGIPASITLAQGILESADGNSPLARYANNHFGIKCHGSWKGGTFFLDDDAKDECFRKYYDVHESYRDHSEFLKTRKWYAPLFELKTTDYKGWAYGLKKAGYATEPKYADLLIRIIEDNQLYKFDRMVELPQSQAKPIMATADVQKAKLHLISLNNNIKYITAKVGDTPQALAKEFEMGEWQIIKYNDLNKDFASFKEGEIIYLQPKRSKSNESSHIVKKGETLHSISQQHGIKMKKLRKKNGFTEVPIVKVGDRIIL